MQIESDQSVNRKTHVISSDIVVKDDNIEEISKGADKISAPLCY